MVSPPLGAGGLPYGKIPIKFQALKGRNNVIVN